MAPPILTLRDIHLSFGSAPLLEGAELSISRGERLCLVGRNGSGKSTLLKIAAGMLDSDAGERFTQPGATIRYLAQEPDLTGYETALAYVEAGFAPGDDLYRAPYLLGVLGLSGDENPAHLSGGEARRCALARALAPEPDILLLDEPTNHLDLPAIEWLEGELKSLQSAIVMISHDRRFLSNLTRATVWIDRGAIRKLDKGFEAFEAWRDEVLEIEEVERHKLGRKIHRENHWLIHGVSGRRKRNQNRLRALHSLRQERKDLRTAPGTAKMTVTEAATSGKLVIEAKSVGKSYGDTPIVTDFSTRIMRGSRVGIVGPNGAGKTTLLNILTGVSAPDSGTVKIGTTLEMVTLDQRRESLDPKSTLADALTGGSGDSVMVAGQQKHVIGYMKDFLFAAEQARTPVADLSGGERGRLMLARAFCQPSNFLVLDEPTNDLDLETLDLLQELLADYPGTVILVSHDRDFLDRVVTSVITVESPGHWREYPGGYSDMIIQRDNRTEDLYPTIKPSTTPSTAPASSSDTTRAPHNKKKLKLGFNQLHALKTLPVRMEELQVEIAYHQATLSDAGLYARDPAAFDTTAAALKSAEEALASAEEEWLSLELLRESYATP